MIVKKDSFDFFYRELFLPLEYVFNNINRITELSYWAKGIIGVVMSFVFVGTSLLYNFRLAAVPRSIN